MKKQSSSFGRRVLRVFTWTLVAVFVLIVSGCGIAAALYQRSLTRGGYVESWDKDDGRILTGSYGEGATNRYDLYLHKSINPKVETPLLLFVHGGSWMGGKRDDMAYACKYYGKKGCITATMDYSLISDNHPEITIKTMLDEITACTAALKKQLESEGYHVSGMAIGGTSAGGHLSLLYAYSRASESAIPLAFVFEKVGPVAFSKEVWGTNYAAAMLSLGTGKKFTTKQLDTPEAVKAANSLSPLHFISSKSVPTIFAYGGRDTLVKPVHRDELVKALEENHVPNIRIDFPNSDHIMWNDPDCTEQFREAVLKYCSQYLKLTHEQPTGENAPE